MKHANIFQIILSEEIYELIIFILHYIILFKKDYSKEANVALSTLFIKTSNENQFKVYY